MSILLELTGIAVACVLILAVVADCLASFIDEVFHE